ncbi:MAG: energy-coupled thiamine transporter ThiT [Clostridia bacterium]|nr:energy-coupled thiamine transporter ThiT [Clostridia bacterium]
MDLDAIIKSAQMVALYLTVALIGAVIIVGALVYKFKRESFDTFKKYVVGLAVGYAVGVLVLFAYLKGESVKLEADMSTYGMLFYPILATVVAVLAGCIAMLVASLFSKMAMKIAGFATLALALGGFIAIMVEMSKYYEGVADWYPNANLVGLIVSAVVFMVLIAGAYLLGDKRDFNDTKSLVYGAIAIAMAYALSYIKFFRMPQGGSITFASMLPLLIYACMFGTRRGTIVCLIYGTLQALQDPWIIHPMQFLLDYTLAYGVIGVSGLLMEKGVFKNKKIFAFLTGGVLAVVLRYACHVCSGVFAFADYADLDTYSSALAYSFAYNSSVFIDMIIALAAGSTLFLSKSFSAQMQRSMDDKKAEPIPYDEHHDHGDVDDDFTPFIVPTEKGNDENPEE